MRIASITAGAAGMFCGSCMKDNTLAKALRSRGHDIVLIPTYTPLTLDEPDQSRQPIYLGGVNVYLDESPWSRWLPRPVRWVLDRPAVLNFATRFAGRAKYEELGDLAVSMLKGEAGRQSREIAVLAEHLATELKPDIVLLTNVLISGIAPAIRHRMNVPILGTLQGDDVFLRELAPGHRQQAIEQIRVNGQSMAGYLSTSSVYADHIASYLGLDRATIDVVHPGINLDGHGVQTNRDEGEVTLGFFARIAPEKGLHRVAEVFRTLRGRGLPVRLKISGWLGPRNRDYLNRILAECGEGVSYVESTTHADKVRFLQSIDIFSLPATIVESKGLSILEAMANGVPVVQPRVGVFPEYLESTGGGLLVDDTDEALLAGIERLVRDAPLRRELGERGRKAVREQFSAEVMAAETERVLVKHLPPSSHGSAV